MEITHTDDGLLLAGLDLFLVELLRQIPLAADPEESDAARDRLFAKPTKDPATNAEWESLVQPELEELFQSAMTTLKKDLARFESSEESGLTEYSLLIPVKHFDSWLNSLNQARLALAARHHFTEKDLGDDNPGVLSTARDLSLFQIHFYGFLQECLVREMM